MLLGLGGLAVVILLLGGAVAVYALVKYLSIERIANLGVDTADRGDPRNYLVVGSDERADGDADGRRSDTMMVVRFDPDGGRASLLSIPRDLVVEIDGTGEQDRINHAYALGRSTLLDTIRDNLGIEIHHYVEVDFASFASLVDAAGGVPLWIDSPIKDQMSGLYLTEPGCVTLDGEQALAYVRARELQYLTSAGTWSLPDPTADLGRIERQQVFMQRAVAEAVGRARSDPRYLPGLVDIGVGAVTIDDQMSIRDLLDLAGRMGDFDPDALTTFTLPVTERDDGATLALDSEAAEPVLDIFRGREPDGEADVGAVDDAAGTPRAEDGPEPPGDVAGAGAAAGDPGSGGGRGSEASAFTVGSPPPGREC